MSEEKTKVIKMDQIFQEQKKKTSSQEYYLIIISGENTGKIFPINKKLTKIGRNDSCEIQVMESSVSREHARLQFNDSGVPILQDMQSTNGTFVNGFKIEEAVLNEDDKIQFGLATVFKIAKQDSMEMDFQTNLYESSIKDPLTNIYNKRYFNERLKRDFTIALRNFRSLSLMMIDIDHFKKLNDTFGHIAGDEVLKSFAVMVEKELRKTDIFCRYGGEEFIVIIKDCKKEMVTVIAERVRTMIEECSIAFEDKKITFTCSIGISSLDDEHIATVEDLISEADKKLYKAKNDGRNCVRI